MKNTRLTLTAALLAAAWTSAAAADPNAGQGQPRPPLGNNPHPVIWGGQPVKSTSPKPAPPAPQPSAARSSDHHADHDHPRHGCGRSHTYIVYGYDPYYYAYSYPYLYAYPPVYLSTEDLYGPRAVQRVMGLGDGTQLRQNADFMPAARENEKADAAEPKKAVDRATNAQAGTLARRFIGFGDALFAEQRFADANERYRKASHSAPQLADAWFRQGFALAATGRYDLAVGAIKRGLKLNPNWPKSGFQLQELYGPDAWAKDARLDALAEAAEAKPNDTNLLSLVGVHFYFDGQPQRAEKFFQRAKEFAGEDAEHVKAFLGK